MAPLSPSSPSEVMVIRKVTPNITTYSLPFNRFGKLKIGGRGTVVRLSSGALAIFSPIALTPEVRAEVDSLGANVRYICAPDFEHHIFIGDWAKAYPSAKILGVEGLPEKREGNKATAGTTFHHVWTTKNQEGFAVDKEFDAEFEYEYVHGHANKELVFYHKPDKTLIEADLIFNLPAIEQYSRTKDGAQTGALTKLFNGLNGTAGPAIWQKRFSWYVAGKDRVAFAKSVKRIDTWDFERIIPCHGDVIENDAKGIFRKIMEWYLVGKK